MNKRALGNEKERIAAAYIKENQYEIIEQNFYSRYGEIDLICKKESYLVFVEVKYRKEVSFGYPQEAVTYRKQQSIMKTARYYMYKNGISEDTPCRFDAVCILGEEIYIIENCMEYTS